VPYIKTSERMPYYEHLQGLTSELSKQSEENLGGHFNFCVSYLLKRLWENKSRYVRLNTLRGAIDNAVDEWYRCNAVDYEKEKKEENGDI